MSAFEKHYSVKELAKLWSFSGNTIRRRLVDFLGCDLPGVVKMGHRETRIKRRYVKLGIPESIAEQLYAQLTSLPLRHPSLPRLRRPTLGGDQAPGSE